MPRPRSQELDKQGNDTRTIMQLAGAHVRCMGKRLCAEWGCYAARST